MVRRVEVKNNFGAIEGQAFFHRWGEDIDDDGPHSVVTAVIEWPDGRVEVRKAQQIRFLSSISAFGPEKSIADILDMIQKWHQAELREPDQHGMLADIERELAKLIEGGHAA